jgi:hypothetical protein
LPPMQRSAAAASTPSGAPPVPIYMSTPVLGSLVAITPATSPSGICWMPQPMERNSAISFSCRGRSSTQTMMSAGSTPLAAARERTFSLGERSGRRCPVG